MKAGVLRDMTVDQLQDELRKLKKEQFNLRFQMATGQLENTARTRQVRRDVARIMTIAAQKQSGTESVAVKQPKPAPAKAAKPAKDETVTAASPPKKAKQAPAAKKKAAAKKAKAKAPAAKAAAAKTTKTRKG